MRLAKQKLNVLSWLALAKYASSIIILYSREADPLSANQVYAAASEDMDTLCFESPILLRHLTFSEQRKLPIQEIHLDKTLAGLNMTREQFIDLCILLGCDYCDSIPKVGPTTALKLIRQYKTIEKVIENLGGKYELPEYFPYQDARELFLKPDVIPADKCEFKWEAP